MSTAVASRAKARSLAIKPADKAVLWAVLLLTAFGVVAVYSAIAFLAETKSGGDPERFLLRHVLRTALALGAAGVLSIIDYRRLAAFSKLFLIGSLALLAAVQIVGVASGGAVRWLEIAGFQFQPSDFAKVALLLHVAVLLARKQSCIKDFKRTFVPLAIWAAPTLLLIGIEDLSTAAILTVAVGIMAFVARMSLLQLSSAVGVGLVLATALLMVSPGRAARVEAHLNVKIFAHTSAEQVFSSQAEGYQARQSRIAFALGGLTGTGPGKSIQRDFLPAPYNDFIFAIVAEEYGLLGASFLLLLFVVLLFRGFLRIARQAPDPLGLFLSVGITATLVLYGFVNAGVASGLMPVTGLPMPFVSYGGTSLVANGALIGILLNISRNRAT
jgi:cell division protein FtsW